MTIFENKKLERNTFRKLRDETSLAQREYVEKNVKLYVDSFVNQYKKIDVSEYSPAQIKLTIAGSGKASKKDILDAVMYSLDLNKPPKPDDSADALAIALTKLNEDGIN